MALYLLRFSFDNISSQETLTPWAKITFFFFSTEINFTINPALLHISTGTTSSMSSVWFATITATFSILNKSLSSNYR
jgi:hypothetical protein